MFCLVWQGYVNEGSNQTFSSLLPLPRWNVTRSLFDEVITTLRAAQGGGIYIDAGSLTATGCSIYSNIAGSGVSACLSETACNSPTPLLERFMLAFLLSECNHFAVWQGGGLHIYSGTVNLDGCVISGNTAFEVRARLSETACNSPAGCCLPSPVGSD